MLKHMMEARALEGYRLYLRFDDGTSGKIDLGQAMHFEGIPAPLKNQIQCAQVRKNQELGTIEWPCGAGLYPDVLYARPTGQPLPQPKAQPLSI